MDVTAIFPWFPSSFFERDVQPFLLSKPAGPHYGSPCLSMYWVGLKLRSEGSDRLRVF